MLSAKTSKFL